MSRQFWISKDAGLPLARQCALAGVARSTFHDHQSEPAMKFGDILLSRLIDEEYTRRPFYGSRRMVFILNELGHTVNRKRVQRLMREMNFLWDC